MNKSATQKWKNAYLFSNDERGIQIRQKVSWSVSKIMDILLLIALFGLAFFARQELHVIIAIAIIIIIKTVLKIYFRFIFSHREEK
jgi:energy-coupling factor transporter transmembrane protein EcfT